jgi:hypothetical protein
MWKYFFHFRKKKKFAISIRGEIMARANQKFKGHVNKHEILVSEKKSHGGKPIKVKAEVVV